MNKVFTILILSCCLVWGCTHPNSGADARTTLTARNKEREAINNMLKKYEAPSQFFTVPAGKPAFVRGKKGTEIAFDPADLITESGKPLRTDITVELKELHNQGDLFRTGAQTVSDGKLLVSGGAYYIGMRSGEEQVRLKEGRQLEVRFPRIAKEKMNLFYGERDASGLMNWKQAPAVFTTTAMAKPVTAGAGTTKTESEIDAIMDYVDSGYIESPEAKQAHTEKRKDYAIAQKLYDAIAVKKMGWINCDRFWNYENVAELSIRFPIEDDVRNAAVYLVFENINSVMQDFASKEKGMLFANLPVGQPVKLVAFTVDAGNIKAYVTKLTIVKEEQITLDLKAVTEQDFKRITGK